MKAHDGTITVTSEPAKPTTVTVRLPLEPAQGAGRPCPKITDFSSGVHSGFICLWLNSVVRGVDRDHAETTTTLNHTTMKRIPFLLAALAVLVFASGCATEKSQAELRARAKISQAQAQQTALTKAPGGTVKSSELEEEKGRLVWSFDIAKPGTKDLTEVLVDAVTGDVVSIENESPAQQEQEEKEKVKEKTDKSWTETLTVLNEPLSPTGRNRYFILEPGYQLVLEGNEGREAVRLIITVLNDTKQVAGVETRIVEERETADGQLAEVSRNYFAVGAQSHNVYYFGEEVDVYKGGQVVAHEGAWLAGVNGATFGILMPGEIKIGARYYQEKAPKVAMDRAENVSVSETLTTPAATFTRCLKVKETTPLEPDNVEYKLYAPEVGLVQDGALRLVKHGSVKQ